MSRDVVACYWFMRRKEQIEAVPDSQRVAVTEHIRMLPCLSLTAKSSHDPHAVNHHLSLAATSSARHVKQWRSPSNESKAALTHQCHLPNEPMNI